MWLSCSFAASWHDVDFSPNHESARKQPASANPLIAELAEWPPSDLNQVAERPWPPHYRQNAGPYISGNDAKIRAFRR
jgi:hypothetical protein